MTIRPSIPSSGPLGHLLPRGEGKAFFVVRDDGGPERLQIIGLSLFLIVLATVSGRAADPTPLPDQLSGIPRLARGYRRQEPEQNFSALPSVNAQSTEISKLSSAVDFLEKHPGDAKGISRLTSLGHVLAPPSVVDPRELRRLIRHATKSVKNQTADRRRALHDLSAAAGEGWRTSPAALLRACRGADMELEVALEAPPEPVRQYLRSFCPSLENTPGPPSESAIHRVAGFLAYARVHMDSALTEWDQALTLTPHDTALKSIVQSLRDQQNKDRQRSAIYHTLNQADRAKFEGDTLRAIALYRKVLTMDPHHPVARDELRRWESQQALEKQQSALGAALRKARAEESARRPEEARPYWLKVLEIDPLNNEARERLAKPRTPPAPPPGAPIPATAPGQAEEFYSLGLVRYAVGDLSGARTAFSRCLKLNPQHPRAARALTRVSEEERARP